ncbi:Uncharacterised protein [Segatella copri]|nr:Uncharacterised protein [Segatella copri]
MMNSAIFRQTLAVLRFSMPSRADEMRADVTIRKRRNSLRKPFVNFRISRFAVQEDWNGRTAIRSQNSM